MGRVDHRILGTASQIRCQEERKSDMAYCPRRNPHVETFAATLLALAGLTVSSATTALAEPLPGDVFKEFTWTRGRPTYIVNHSLCYNSHCPTNQNSHIYEIDADLEGAVRAEAVAEFWSGHVGTSEHAIEFNGNERLVLPLPENTPDNPECYFSIQGQATVEVPLEHLHQGVNTIHFTCQEQICHGFDYPAFGVYGVNLRVYYDDSRVHPTGSIVLPGDGSVLGENPTLRVTTSEAVESVAFVGEYEDYDWESNGLFRQWHYRFALTELERHLGTAGASPWEITWENSWIPDQPEPMSLVAWIRGQDGMTYVTEASEGIQIYRSRSVKMYTVLEMPHRFGARVGKRTTCEINVDDDLAEALAAKLVVFASAPHEAPGEFGLNEEPLGTVEAGTPSVVNQAFREATVPLDVLRVGTNTFYITSETEHHAMEVHWPGPALLIAFPNTDPPPIPLIASGMQTYVVDDGVDGGVDDGVGADADLSPDSPDDGSRDPSSDSSAGPFDGGDAIMRGSCSFSSSSRPSSLGHTLARLLIR